jgi:hypothetical protein
MVAMYCMLQVMSRCQECAGVRYFGAAGNDAWRCTPEPILYRSSADYSSPIFRGEATGDEYLRVLMEREEAVEWMSEDPLGDKENDFTTGGSEYKKLYTKKVNTVGGKMVESGTWGISPRMPMQVDTWASPCKCCVTPPPPEVQDMNQRLNGFRYKIGQRENIDLSNYSASPRWGTNGWRSPKEDGEYSDVSEVSDSVRITSTPECYITGKSIETPDCYAYDPASRSGSLMWGLKGE